MNLKTPANVKALLASVKKRATNAQIAKYCSKSGRPFVDPVKLAAHLKTL
jgi:hypothetical protein